MFCSPFEHGENRDIFVQKDLACTIETPAKVVMRLFVGDDEKDIKVIKNLVKNLKNIRDDKDQISTILFATIKSIV